MSEALTLAAAGCVGVGIGVGLVLADAVAGWWRYRGEHRR